jgi:Fe-S oxidoreductase
MKDFAARCTRCMACENACPLTRYGGGIGPLLRKLDAEGAKAVDGDPGAWKCTMCMNCDQVCPEGLSPREWLVCLRLGHKTPEAYVGLLRRLSRSGFVFPNENSVDDMEEMFPWSRWLYSADA